MNNDIFLDSSILIEHYKGTQTDLLEALITESEEPGIKRLASGMEEMKHLDLGLEVDTIASGSWEEAAKFNLYINQTVLSEYLFQCLKVDSGGQPSPLTLKRDGKIPALIRNFDHADFLGLFQWLHDDSTILILAPELMERYNLLPNDAIILSLCKINQINAIQVTTDQILKISAEMKIFN